MADKKNPIAGAGQMLSDASRAFFARMAERRRKLGHMEFVRQVTYALLLPTAAYTTWHGMYEMVRFNMPNGGPLLWLVTVMVAAMLFFLMNYTITVWRSFQGLLSRFAALVLYIVTAGISVGFAFAFWWTTFYSHEQTEKQTELAASVLTCFVSQAANDLTALQTSMQSLSAHSTAQSNTEATAGGTCGYATGAEPGPRSRKRAADAADAQDKLRNISGLVSGLNQELTNLKTELAVVNTEEFRTGSSKQRSDRIAAINRAIASTGERLNAARTSQILDQYIASFQERITENRDGFLDGGRLYSCPDATLEDNMTAAIGAIQRVKDTPDISQRRVPYIEEGRATMYAFQLYLNTLFQIVVGAPQTQAAAEAARGRVAAGSDSEEGQTGDCRAADLDAVGNSTPGVITGTEWFVFFLALFIDLGIAAVGLGKPRDEDEQLRKEIERAQSAENAAVLDLVEQLQNSDAGLRGMVGPYHVTVFGEDYLIVPAHPETEDDAPNAPRAAYAVGNFVTLLEVARLAYEVTPSNPFLRNLLRRFDLKQGAAKGEAPTALPGAEESARQEDRGAVGRIRHGFSRLFSWLGREAVSFVSDEELAAARRRYSFFKVGRSMFKKLHLRSITRKT